jgi:ATPase subunit of ABC transporter with duplicated ATPase domains
MSRLVLDNVACVTPDHSLLFSGLNLAIGREVVGLVGRNGSGKSTLLEAIVGLRPVAGGSIVREGAIGFLRQDQTLSGTSVAEALNAKDALARLERIELGHGSESDFAEADWDLPSRLANCLEAVGLAQSDLDRSINQLSGGERTRVMLAALLLADPHILLLDEPTNDLDEAGRTAIAELLSGWKGTALVASHDRELLRGFDRIVELTSVGIHIVSGGWDAFVAQRAAERERAKAELTRSEANLKNAQREKQRETEKRLRRDKQGRALAAKDIDPRVYLHRQQQRAEKTAARYRFTGDELVGRASDAASAARAEVEQITPVTITLPPSGLSSRHVLVSGDGLVCERNGTRLFGPLDLTIRGPERIALTGANGSGKTSLIKLILGSETPAQGQIVADRVSMALLDQHLTLVAGGENLLETVRRNNPNITVHAAHEVLAAYGFRNRWASRKADELSGGERVRLALTCLFARTDPPQMLVLDEPTNHLDTAAIELLEAAIRGYDGAVLCVSHDVAFRHSLNLTRTITL